MQRNEITRRRLRRLAETTVEDAKVLSVYLGLDPREFATQPARASAIRSLLNEAGRVVRETGGLTHEERAALEGDLERVESFFEEDFSAEGVHGLAIFAAGRSGLFEVIRLPEAPEAQVAIGDSPFVEPLTRIGAAERWAVLLVSRAEGRLFRGSRSRLTEVRSTDDDVHQQHSQGGWSQARYQRSVEQEVQRHIERSIAELQASYRRAPFDHLLIAAPEDAWTFAESQLDDELRSRLAGRFTCDASDATSEDVLEAAREAMTEAEAKRERELLDRLSDALGMDGPASHSLADVLDALVQRKVGTLLLDETFEAPGVACRVCGWLGADGDRCPVDDSELEQHEDVVEPAVEAALLQSAQTVYVRHHPDLQPLGGIASLNRF